MSHTSGPLWQVFELNYFRRRPPFRAWKRWLSVAGALGAIAWVAIGAVGDDESIYASGTMSVSHSMLARQCHLCHTESWAGVRELVAADDAAQTMNNACLHCHGHEIAFDPSTHNARHQTDTPGPTLACARCHVEHEGYVRLNDMPDRVCVQCHRDLQPPATNFATGHPPFRAGSTPDASRVWLNHELHLRPGLPGPGRRSVTMTCSDCHRAGSSAEPWEYGARPLHEGSHAAGALSEPSLRDDYMAPIRYALHCAGCHPLGLDARLGADGAVPHETPEAIRTFLWGQLTRYVQTHGDALTESRGEPESLRPQLSDAPPQEFNQRVLAWVEREVLYLEEMLYTGKKVCVKCHEQILSGSGGGLPRIASPQIPIRWLEHASFSHEKHRVLSCLECHAGAQRSARTSDVLLPRIEQCRACHAPIDRTPSTFTGGVSHSCVQCHTYHAAPSPAESLGRALSDLLSDAPR